MAHPMENRINLFSLIRGSLYAYLRSTVRGNIRHDTRAPETGVPFMSLFCFAYLRLRLAFLYIYFLKQKIIKVSTILGMYEMTMYHKRQTWKIQANSLSFPEPQQFLNPFPRNISGNVKIQQPSSTFHFAKSLKTSSTMYEHCQRGLI